MPLKQPSQSPASGGQPAEADTPPLDPLDEALEETFPASDPITPAQRADPKTRSDS